jgi:hypothetical protein
VEFCIGADREKQEGFAFVPEWNFGSTVVARKDSRLLRNHRFTHRPILEALFLLLEVGKQNLRLSFTEGVCQNPYLLTRPNR